MRKRNKLYTANKWNQPLFMGNTFDEGGLTNPYFNKYAQQEYGSNYGNKGYTTNDYMNSKNAFGISKADNPFSKANLANTFSLQNIGPGLINAGIGAVGGLVGNAAFKGLSGGYSSGVGNAIHGVGDTIGGALGSVPIVGGLASAAVKGVTGIVGGAFNGLFGKKVNKAKLNAANQGTDYLNNFTSNASSFDDITGPNAVASVQNAYSGGVFKKGWARRKNAELRTQRQTAESWANRSVDNNIDNIADTQMDNLEANFAAFGGPLGNSGAIDYGFMSDYLTAKNRDASVKDKLGTNIFGSLASTPIFALGGDMQTNGADFSDGLVSIDAGGFHEENPYQGVQVGISRDNGEPNLVEEGETIFDDYVFSKRIKADAKTKKKFHIGKNADISYADLSKKLEKESLERPNDPISQNALTKQLHELAEEQERQKGEEKAKQAQEVFNSLPPEQQAEIMQQIAMQEQQAQQVQQQQSMQGEQQVEEPQQPMEGQQMPDSQMQGQQEQMEQPMQNAQMSACGGKLNRFDKGGELKKQIYKRLEVYTDADFDKWLTDHKTAKVTDWDNVLQNKAFMEALSGANPALSHVLSMGYDFGTYQPNKGNNLTFDFLHGGWGSEDYNAWNGSNDAAWKEAVKKGLVKEGMNSEDIGKALMQTDAYKRGTDFLNASEDNRLRYLQSIYNSPDASQAAKDFAGKFIDNNGWKKDAKRDYQSIFGEVRTTHPGTYWKTPDEVLRDNVTTNYEVAPDGSIHEIIGDVPNNWKKLDSFAWNTDQSNNNANYFQRPVTAQNANDDMDSKVVPKHRTEVGRYLGLMGPAVGLGMQLSGIGKPDYSRLDASLGIARQSPALAHANLIGDYVGKDPLDVMYELNRMDASSRATDRTILNNSSPIGVKNAGLIANAYNRMIAEGDQYRKAREYNRNDELNAAKFNRETNIFNANTLNQTSATNADLLNRNRQFQAQMSMDAARQRMEADASWNNGIYGNINNLFKGLGDWGKENAQHNMIANMAADSIFGVGSGEKQNTFRGYTKTVKASKGGKLRRKRGLTF